MSEIKRTMFETTKADKADVITHNPEGNLPGSGFCCLLIAGDNNDGEKELLELRFKSDFLPHIEKLVKQLKALGKTEDSETDDVVKAAQALVDGDTEEMSPFVRDKSSQITKVQTVLLGGDELSKEELRELKKKIIADLEAKEGLEEDTVEHTMYPDPDNEPEVTDVSTEDKSQFLAEITRDTEEADASVGELLDDMIEKHCPKEGEDKSSLPDYKVDPSLFDSQDKKDKGAIRFMDDCFDTGKSDIDNLRNKQREEDAEEPEDEK